jgi:hypothetical protein
MPRSDETAPPALLGPGLRSIQFWAIVAVTFIVFLFVRGPVWQHDTEPDAAILLSYAPIPFLVAGCLLWNRTLAFRNWMVSTISLFGIKFLLTAAVLLSIVFIRGPREVKPTLPPHPGLSAAEVDVHSIEALDGEIAALDATPATLFKENEVGRITGSVVDKSGVPVARALVYISAGLEPYHFKLVHESVRMTVGDGGFLPALLTARYYQPIQVAARDRATHTFMAVTERRGFLLNRPLLRPTDVCIPRRAVGQNRLPLYQQIRVSCAMHPAEAGHLFVFSHPFHALTAEDGTFMFDGVPQREVRVAAWSDTLGRDERTTQPAPGRDARVELRLAKSY